MQWIGIPFFSGTHFHEMINFSCLVSVVYNKYYLKVSGYKRDFM